MIEVIFSNGGTSKMGKEVEVTLKVKVKTRFDDDESNEETVRYLLEQDLEDMGWDCDVEVME